MTRTPHIALFITLLALAPTARAQVNEWQREVEVFLTRVPEAPIVALRLELEVPSIYKVAVPPTTPLSDIGGSTGGAPIISLAATPTPTGGTRILLTVLFIAEPALLDPRVLEFTITAEDPDVLPAPIRLRYFSAVLEDGRRSKAAWPQVFVQSHPSAIYGLLP